MAEAEDRSGIGFGNGDMFMALLVKEPEKVWSKEQVKASPQAHRCRVRDRT